uniref:Integrase, catalytic region, zinc finger, CCHC-type, peptidase aspartic, catalytic n=1 Tax=Tanacetum cinerariifolium TaxID=118510 RepID=A0A6L2MK41_TANCI|nr:hypothetical protein [Tanacetum cinerariifolium]
MIDASAENRPPMLDKTMYDSWESRMKLFIEGKENRRIMLKSIKNGPLVWPTEVDEQGLLPDVYSLVNHHRVAKDIWDRVKLLIQGTSLTKQGGNISSVLLEGNAAGVVRNNAVGQGKVIKCYNYQAQKNGQILDEEQLAFLADPRIPNGQAAQITILQNAAFQTKDLDAYDSDCDDLSLAKAVLMANLSSCNSDVLSEPHIDETPDNEITSDSNIIPYYQYLLELQSAGSQNINSSAHYDLLVMSLVEQIPNMVAALDKQNQENSLENKSLTAELERYKERVKQFEER